MQNRSDILAFLHQSLSESLERYRDQFSNIIIESGNLEQHQHFIPLIAELLRREESRGTKGMSGSDLPLETSYQMVAAALESEQAVLVRNGDELIGYATLGPWDLGEMRVLEFCSAVVDDEFRGLGFGRLLVDAREILALEQYIPNDFQPMAFCNEKSARIYNTDLWHEVPWEWYRQFPPPVVCRPECQENPETCDCVVLAMDLDAFEI